LVKIKKEAILKSAELLFSTNGFNQTTVSDIAKESGIPEPSIYSYFGNKRGILFAIYGAYLQNAIETLNEHFQGMKEPGPKLRKSIWHYLADLKNSPNYARILLMAQRESPEFYASAYLKDLQKYSSLIVDCIIAGQREGLFRKNLNPRLIRNMAMGASVFTAIDSIVYSRPYDPNETSDVIYQLVMNATGTERPAVENSTKILRNERTEIRRNKIIDNAVQVFADRGFSNATISEIAKQADLGDATLYEYFENKEAILLEAAEAHLRNLASSEDSHLKNLSDPEKNLRKLLWRFIWQLYTSEAFSRVLVLELFRNINFYSSPGYRYLLEFGEEIRRVVEQGQAQGVFLSDVPYPTYFYMILGTFDQFLLAQFLLKRPPLGLSELIDTVDAIARAIKDSRYPR
jgi:TetR/AcrR family transcriptional regulator, fatty acid metabolism regulator protein